MSSLTPFLLAATMITAFGAATVSQAQTSQPQPAAAHASLAQLRAAAGRASVIESAVLVLAAK